MEDYVHLQYNSTDKRYHLLQTKLNLLPFTKFDSIPVSTRCVLDTTVMSLIYVLHQWQDRTQLIR